MRELRKEPLESLEDFPTAFVWPTELNELRSLAKESAEYQAGVLLRELKMLALFHAHVLIEDPYVVNSIGFQRLLCQDRSPIRRAVEAGIIVLMLRPTFDSYSHANQIVKSRRFIPERFGGVDPALAEIDSYLSANRIPVCVQTLVGEHTFDLILETLIRSDTLTTKERDRLALALEFARRQATDGKVSAADVQRHIETYPAAEQGRLIQACRAARVLVGPLDLHVPASVADSDVSRSFVLAATGPTIVLDLNHAESLVARYPQRILPRDGFEKLTFADICILRDSNAFARYRRALIRLRTALAAADDINPLRPRMSAAEAPWRSAFVEYLEGLQIYLDAIACQIGLNLGVVRLSGDAEYAVKKRISRREHLAQWFLRFIPIVGTAASGALVPTLGFQILPALIGSLAVLAAGEIYEAAKERAPLKRLVDSSTIAAK